MTYLEKLTMALAGLMFAAALGGGAGAARAGPTTQDLVLWLEADQGLAADGSTWTDQSGQGHNATAVAGQAPAFVKKGLNKLPVARFSAGQSMTLAGPVLSSQKFTILAVVTDTSSPEGGYREVISNWSASTGGMSIFLGTIWGSVGGVTTDRIRFTDSIGGAAQGQTGQGMIAKPAKAFVLSGLASASNAVIRVGSKIQYRLGSPLPARDLAQPWYLGDQGSLDSEFWQGDIAEVLVYDAALSKSEMAADIAYLQAKWNAK
jgi:hypothetical protein